MGSNPGYLLKSFLIYLIMINFIFLLVNQFDIWQRQKSYWLYINFFDDRGIIYRPLSSSCKKWEIRYKVGVLISSRNYIQLVHGFVLNIFSVWTFDIFIWLFQRIFFYFTSYFTYFTNATNPQLVNLKPNFLRPKTFI